MATQSVNNISPTSLTAFSCVLRSNEKDAAVTWNITNNLWLSGRFP